MKNLAFLLGFALAASVGLAQEPPGQQPPPAQPPGYQPPAAADTKEFTAQVVSTDPMAKTITIKKEGSVASGSADTTLPVEAGAVATLSTVMPGEKVKLTCRTSGGKETAVTAIKKTEEKPKSNP